MKRISLLALLLLALIAAVVCAVHVDAQTITMNDASNAGCIISATNPCPRAGLNLGQASGAFPQFKNLLQFANPGFEPQLVQQIYQFAVNPCTQCTPTTFQWNVSNSNFAAYDTNQWTGANFTVSGNCYSGMTSCTGGGTADPANGCTGTIALNTANTGGFGPIFTINSTTNQGSSGCAGPLGIPGQLITISTNSSMTNVGPPSVVGWPQATISGSVTAESTDVCSGCGTQSVEFSGSSSLTLSNTAYTTLGVEKTITLNGNYTISFMAKSVSGSTTALTFTLTTRNGACANPSPCTYTPTLTTSWASYSHTFALTETPSPSDPFSVGISFAVSSGADVRFDNVAFTDPSTNPTAFADTFVNTLKAYCQTANNTTGPGCTLRYGPSPDSEVMSNWVKSVFLAQPSTEAANSSNISFTPPSTYVTQKPRIYDFLQLCSYVGATPVLIIPITMTAADMANLVDYLEDNAGSTTYGAIRQTQGQTTAWVGQAGSPFGVIFIEMGNENWNGLFLGHALFGHTNNPNNYFDYGVHIGIQIAAARTRQTAQSYSTAVTKWMANGQTGSTTDFKYLTAFICGQPGYSGGTITCTQGGEDGIEIQQYYATSINSVSTTNCTSGTPNNANCALYGPTLTETWSNLHDPSSTSGVEQSYTAIQGIANCGSAHTATCLAATYERAIYPQGTTNFTQAVSDSFTETGWHGVADAVAYADSDSAGFGYIEEYASESYALSQGSPAVNVHIYGAFIDNGGDTATTNSALFGGNYTPRPQMGAAEVVNYCKIGQEVSTTGSSIPTYNLPSNTNGVNAINNVPYLTFHEYKNGSTRCLLINNNDIANAHTVTLAGTNVPSSVTLFQQAPSSPTATNEATNLNSTSTVAATVYPVLTTGVGVGSGFSAPATSSSALEWTVGGSPGANPPTFSPVAGSYTGTQSVTISTTSSGAIICYNTTGSPATNGTTGCTVGTLYSGAVTVSSSETLYAVAGGTGYTDSSVASAVYTITNIAANFNSRSGGSTIPAGLMGTGVAAISANSPLSLLASPRLDHVRLFVDINQNCPAGVCGSWGIPQAQITDIIAGHPNAKVMLVVLYTPSNLGTFTCTPPSNPTTWAGYVNAGLSTLTAAFPGVIDAVEIWNEPDAGTVGGTTGQWCPATGTLLAAYKTLVATAGPAIASANPTLKVGMPALASPGLASTWFGSGGILASWSSPAFVSYHLYLAASWASWASLLAQMQNTSGGNGFYFQSVESTLAGQGYSGEVWITEQNDGYAFSADCCRYDSQFSLIYNTLSAIDYLNLVNSYSATSILNRFYYFNDEGQYFCLFGTLAPADCSNNAPTAQAPYPQYYAYMLLNNLNLPSGGNVATSVSPASTTASVSCTAFYTATGDSVLCVNPTASAATGQVVGLNNTGYSSPLGFQYLLNQSNPTVTVSALSLTSTGGTNYTATVTIPAYSALGMQVTSTSATGVQSSGRLRSAGRARIQ